MAKVSSKTGIENVSEVKINPAKEDGNLSTIKDAVIPLSTVINGQKTVSTAGTAEALAASTSVDSVTVKALAGNTNNVYVGDSSVSSSNGFVLAAGESVSMDVDDLSIVYLDVDTNGEGVSYIAIN